MYHISPRNSYISVYPIETDKKEESRAFIIPTEMEEISPYTVVRVIEDSMGSYVNGTLLLVPTQVLEKAQIGSQTAFFVTTNYVIGVLVPTEG